MAAPFWQAGNFYLPGDLVQPVTAPAPNNPQVANGGFAGATGWTFSGSAAYTASGGYGGGGCVQLPGNQPDGVALNNAQLVVPVGATLTATAMIQQGASVAGATAGWAEVRWYSATNVELSIDKGNVVDSGSGGAWHQSKVDAVCPAGAAYARAAIHLTSVADHSHAIFGDNLSVSGASAGLPDGLVYRAVQPESGTSGANEPAWPGILGLQVVDNDVIWEAVTTSRITWTASPRYVSGATEPTWPTDIGAMVQDGTINWEAVSRRVEDERCPNSKVVAIVASKVFAVDKDIVKFCATANPLDWSTADDAGYLPTGLQQANSNDMAVLQQYRANLVALNASSFQNWQVDPDPAAMAILDQMDGIGSVWPKAAVPVSNDLLYVSQLGVRTVGIANAAENLSAGDVGAPVDVMVQESLRVTIANGIEPIGTYYPGAGQYWLAFRDYTPPPLVVTGDLPDGIVGDWGTRRYLVVGGTPPYSEISVVSGALPPGATLGDDGVVNFTYAQRGNFAWEVGVTDSADVEARRADTAQVCEITWDYTFSIETTPRMTDGNAYYGFAHSPELGITLASVRRGIFSSADGDTWVNRFPADESTNAVAWSPSLGVFVATSKAANNSILTSFDGINFTATAVTGFSAVTRGGAATWGAGRFVVAGVSATFVSSNGVAWARNNNTISNPRTMVYADALGLFILVSGGGGNLSFYTSPDGAAWTLRYSTAGVDAQVCWDARNRVLYCATSADSSILRSTDGINWAYISVPTATAGALAWSPNLGLVSMPIVPSSRYAVSIDGATWSLKTKPSSRCVALIWAAAHRRFTVGLSRGFEETDNIMSSNSALVCDP
jgi:hypothetical protein